MLIDGNFVGGPCDQATPKSLIHSPYDGSIVGSFAEGGWTEANAALDAARSAFEIWRETPAADRMQLLANVSESISERRKELANILALEVGKPITLALGEIDRTAITFRLASQTAHLFEPQPVSLTEDPRGVDFDVYYKREPVGTVFCIVPYNWPFNLAAHKVAPALASGNVALIKPSSLAPLSTLTLVRIVHECGAPPGVIQAICVEPNIAERAALDDRIAMVSFTGSPPVGWHLKSLMPKKRVLLELGGNAFAIVMPDCDIDLAAKRLAFAAFAYAGQICISLQHCLIHESIYAEFRERLIFESRQISVGNPLDEATVCGPLISEAACDRVLQRVRSATECGSKLLLGGSRVGQTIEPTLVESPNNGLEFPSDIELYSEEIFGPVATVSQFANVTQATQIVNRSRFGIHASVFAKDPTPIANSLQVGGVVCNDSPLIRFDAMPYGGVRESGFGREGVEFAIQEMCELKSFVARNMQ